MDQDSPSTEFLYDFLYLDRARASSYFAQVFDHGVLVGSKSSTGVTSSSAATAGVSAHIVSGDIKTQDGIMESIEREFDASWLLPLNVIERLSELSFIGRGLEHVPVGRLSLIRGTLNIMDMKLLKDLWEPVSEMVTKDLSHAQQQATKRELRTIGKILEKLPPTAQMVMQCSDGLAWSTLRPDSVVVNIDDLSLKHGGCIAGEWHCLCVVDADPDGEFTPEPMATGSDLFDAVISMLDGIRKAVGRPANAYGVTPVAIFRAIHKT